jgi:hypothetical protein
VLLSLLKTLTNLLLAKLNLFHQPVVSCLDWACVGTIVGEETISSFSSARFFYWKERSWAKAAVVAVYFCSPFEHIVKRLNFVV